MDTLAGRLNKLFEETAAPGGRAVTLQEIINRMRDAGGATMSLSYLQQLRSGQATNPRVQHLQALANAFGVPLSYFIDDNEGGDEAEDRLTLQERNVMLRLHGLSADALRSIEAMIDIARKSEGLHGPASR